jgi:hypothetical protein
MAPWMAAVPVAQAFSKRVIGLKRSSGTDWRISEEGKPWLVKPSPKTPTKPASISPGSMPASSMAARATRASSASRSGASSSLPKGVCAQPTMQAPSGAATLVVPAMPFLLEILSGPA